MHISLDSCPIPASGIVEQMTDNEAVIVIPHRGEVKILNEVGAYIWKLADGNHCIRDIVAAIHTDYEVEQTQAETDTLAFVCDLIKRNMFILSNSPT
jgi:hypothetical protein